MKELANRQKEEIKKIIGECEMCGEKKNLTIHRVKRGSAGGKYYLRNIMVICGDCHKILHEGEEGYGKK